ncbi:hypothetical protein C5S31_07560 [ANME-1 cluster archaeon GoMg2]|nr:hypothetical protein [ANME-1 cluster archaeon GoMg2]
MRVVKKGGRGRLDTTIEIVREKIRKLVEQFERDKYFYLSKQYLEAQARQDFIDPFFEALGWDIGNKAGFSPFEREVLLEKGDTKGRPDYNFRIDGASKFYVEAKAPSEPLDKTTHILQAKSYAWNSKDVFIVVLTDFEEFKVFDASLKPDPRNPNLGLIYDFKYTDYLEKLDELWTLSRDEVASGSLDRLLLKDAQSKRLRIPVDKSFLSDMTGWREELAKDLYKLNPDINVRMLNEVVQRILDRLVFIRIAEDRKIIEPKSLLELVELWKREGKRRPLQYHLNILFRQINADLNGEIFKPHACERYKFDSALLARIIEWLYFPKCPYRFDVIGVELLGSIYERYLGNTIRLTAKRVKVEEKPEVRKAGGVYYTPKYIVEYIVDNTVGKLIEGKKPEEIAEIKILDPACGSGSFLLGAYQKLIDYHIKYYTVHPAEAGRSTLFPDLIIDPDGSHRLSITKKAEILQNNIFGVDIDPQAVEVSMMSLYIKALEGERTLPQNKELLPSLANNIKCGNSLIGYDFFEQQTLIEDEERERINPFDWNSKKAGFGDIMERGGFDCVVGNPPYGAFFGQSDKTYLLKQYKNCPSSLDSYLLFYERCLGHLLKTDGFLGFITPNTWELIFSAAQFRAFVLTNFSINEIVHYTHKVFKSATVDCEIVIIENAKPQKHNAFVTVQSESKSLQHEILQSFWLSPKGDPFNILLTEKEHALLTKISSKSVHVNDIFLIKNGVKPFEGGKGKPPQTREIVETKPYVSEIKQDDTFRPLLRGSLMQRYINFWNEDYWISYGPWLAAPRDPKIFEAPEKIVCRQTGDRIICTLIDNKFICRDNLHIILPMDCNYNLKYILGILNSSFCDFCYRAMNPEKGEALAQIKKKHLGQLPIRTIDFSNPSEKAKHDKIVALVGHMLELNSKKNAIPPSSERERIEREIMVTDEKIDEMVYGLYGLMENEVKVVEGEWE